MSAPPRVPYWHLWTGEDGVSRQTRCELSDFELKGVGAAAPQWNDKQATGRFVAGGRPGLHHG
jgi:hypothetical protein